jgi:signal peptidase I
MSKSRPSTGDKNKAPGKSTADKEDAKSADGGWRETVESIAMAVILALLFRGFVAEAFVIPTGSMAPTLRGRHKDVECPQCGTWFQTGSSQEIGGADEGGDAGLQTKSVIAGVCPSCRFTRPVNPFEQPNDDSFNGDRIIVSKFIYDFSEPQRWDVIVFKFPGNGTLNYIKRLIGLPNETIRIEGGNIWVRQGKEGEFQIARKPPDKLAVLLQLVSDSEHVARCKLDALWPHDWIEGTPLAPSANPQWKAERTGPHSVAYHTTGEPAQDAWLRFRHLVSTQEEWGALLGNPPSLPDSIAGIRGELITDFCAYNDYSLQDYPKAAGTLGPIPRDARQLPYRLISIWPQAARGENWVDDLAVEGLADSQSETGELLLDVVRAGVHYTCRIDVATGQARLTCTDSVGTPLTFSGGGQEAAVRTAQTSVRGAASYRFRLANCDHQVLLWINGRVVEFDGPTTYDSPPLVAPVSSENDYGDRLPIGIGASRLRVKLSQLRVLRDVYYVAQKNDPHAREWFPPGSADRFFQSPELWTDEIFLEGRDGVEFELGPDQFFPLGDNSPQSQDARTWPVGGGVKLPTPNYVSRDLLIGKAMFVYWPHTWNRPAPYTPNPAQMRPIR